MKRQDTYSVRVSIDNVDLGTWDALSGGDADSDETRYRPGGLAEQISLGGTRTRSNITLRRLYDEFIHGLFHVRLDGRVGKGQVTITRQPLDADGNAYGRPIVYTGTLKSVKAPDVDSQQSDAALIEIEVTPNGAIA